MQLLLPGALHLQQIVRISVSKKENEDCLCWENGFYWCHCHGGTVFCRPGSRRCSDMIVLAGVAVTRSFCTRNSWLRRARMERRSLEVVFLRQWSLEVDSRRQWGRSASRSSTAIKLSARLMSPPPLGGDESPSLALAGTQTSTPSHSRPELPVGGLVCFWPFFFFLYSQYWFSC